MRKYLLNGQAVELIREVDGGFLYYDVWEDGDEYVDDVIRFSEKLFDNPPTEKFHNEINELTHKLNAIREQLIEADRVKRESIRVIERVKEYDFLKTLTDYLDGNFTHVLYLDSMKVSHKDSVYLSPYIKIVRNKNDGFSFYTLRNESYESYDDRPLMIFASQEDAISFAKEKLISNLVYGTVNATYKWSSGAIKDWYGKIDSSTGLKIDEDIKSIYASKLQEAKEREADSMRAKLLAEIEEKQNALNKIK